MNNTKKYFGYLSEILKQTFADEEKAIIKAAELVTKSILEGGKFYTFGSGHSHIIAEEIYLRAGGLAFVDAILPPELMLHQMPLKSTSIERLEGYASSLLNLYEVKRGDTLLVISNSGRNNVPVEMCLNAKEKGLNIIAITSLDHSSQTESRHKSGHKICDIADVTIDNHAPKGDANYYIDGVDVPIGPVSNFTGVALVQSLVVTIIDFLKQADYKSPIFKSSNLDAADEYNKELFNKYH